MSTFNTNIDPIIGPTQRVNVDVLLKKMSDKQKKDSKRRTIIISSLVASVGALFFFV